MSEYFRKIDDQPVAIIDQKHIEEMAKRLKDKPFGFYVATGDVYVEMDTTGIKVYRLERILPLQCDCHFPDNDDEETFMCDLHTEMGDEAFQ